MKKLCTLCLLPLAVGMFGCASPVPIAHNFPVSTQGVARTAHHWDVVANDVVDQTLMAINSNPVLQNRPMLVPRHGEASEFDASFRELLITNMVNRKIQVNVCGSDSPSKSGFVVDSPVKIEYEARFIPHLAGVPKYVPGVVTALTAGVGVIYNASQADSVFEKYGTTLGLAALIDLARANVPTPENTEVFLTTTIADNNRFIMRRTDIYYVPEGDVKLFIDAVAQRSTCPEDQALSDAAAKIRAAERAVSLSEAARAEMFVRNIRRSNPEWGR